MKISDRERKLLYVLGLFIVIICVYMTLPKINEVNTLQAEITEKQSSLEMKENELNVLSEKKINLEEELSQKKENISEEVTDVVEEKSELKYYKYITYGEIIVEINRFVPVSAIDFFNIKEINFSTPEENNENVEAPVAEEGVETPVSNESGEVPTTNVEENFENVVSIENGESTNISNIINTSAYGEVVATIVFEGSYDSLIKFVKNANNNEYVVHVLAVDVKNAFLSNTSLQEDTIEGIVVLSFPTYEGSEYRGDIYGSLDEQYNYAKPDPFDPFPEFIEIAEAEKEKDPYKYIENFSKNPYFFVTNDERNGGYIAKTQKSTDGNASMKINYDFYNRNNDNVVYAVSQNENIILESTPQSIEIDIFNDSANANQVGLVYRDATGREVDGIIADQLSFNGWNTYSITLPSDAVYPVMIQRFYVRSGGSGIKQMGSVLLDNMRIIEYE